MKFQLLIESKILNIFNAHNTQNAVFNLLINVKKPTIVGISTVMSRIDFMLCSVEHEKFYYLVGQHK